MNTIQVIPYVCRRHKETGSKISKFSVLPYGSADDWETVSNGYTWGVTDRQGGYTEGLCRPPAATIEEAIEVAEKMAKLTGATVLGE